jgi:hypothetical protein
MCKKMLKLGDYYQSNPKTDEDLEKALRCFQTAVFLDNTDRQAWAKLAKCYLFLSNLEGDKREEYLEKSKKCQMKAETSSSPIPENTAPKTNENNLPKPYIQTRDRIEPYLRRKYPNLTAGAINHGCLEAASAKQKNNALTFPALEEIAECSASAFCVLSNQDQYFQTAQSFTPQFTNTGVTLSPRSNTQENSRAVCATNIKPNPNGYSQS